MVNYFFSPHLAVKKNNSTLSLKRWIIFFSPLDALKKIIHRIKRWKKKLTATENAVKKNNSPRFTAFTAKRCTKYAVKIIFFFTTFHRISYENSPPNLDPGCVYTKSDASRSTAAQSSRLAFQSQIEFYDPVVSLNSVASPIGSSYWDTGGSRTTFGVFSRALSSTIFLFARFASCYWTVFLFSEQLFFSLF